MSDTVTALLAESSATHAVREFDVAPEELDLTADGWTAAGAVVWNPRGKAAFVETAWSDGWVLPGGSVEPGETFAEAAEREVAEETGLSAEILHPGRVEEQVFRAGDEVVRGWFVAFAARTDQTEFGDDLGEDDDEIAAAAWFSDPPTDTESFVDARALLRDCRLD
ncbi:NUDIX domain-containing protein [Halobacterium wangiae]|uniref:NUDIX domain-containing protein n=1 Tax=Halobacterium wangiae TaxID=2902623 RepID=UPI0022B7A9A3|nr:NUDIX domain-containing protein [Halobacterium wangiae]